MFWLMRREALQEMQRRIDNFKTAGANFSAEQLKQFEERSRPVAGNTPRIYKAAGKTAEISIEGVLTPKPDLFSYYFGGGNTTYSDIKAGFDAARVDQAVTEVELKIASYGGMLEGLFDLIGDIQDFNQKSGKSVRVTASIADSAAYCIAAVAGPITATSPASEFGSIGVATQMLAEPDVVDIASTNAPNKRPDVTTEEGKAVVRAELDAVHELFVDAIAWGRGTHSGKAVSPDQINSDWGKGSVLLANEAKRTGMIDAAPKQTLKPLMGGAKAETSAPAVIASAQPPANNDVVAASIATQEPPAAPQAKPESSAGAEQNDKKGVRMDLATLMAQHPELHKQIVETATTAATAAERKRVNALLRMGTKCGAMDVAVKAVESGATIQDDEVFEAFQSARMNLSAQSARQTDDATAAAALHAGAKAPECDMGDRVVAAMEAGRQGASAGVDPDALNGLDPKTAEAVRLSVGLANQMPWLAQPKA